MTHLNKVSVLILWIGPGQATFYSDVLHSFAKRSWAAGLHIVLFQMIDGLNASFIVYREKSVPWVVYWY